MDTRDPLSAHSLAEIPLFRDFSQRELTDLRQALELQRKRQGAAILREGQVGGQDFYILLEGTVEIQEQGRPVDCRGPRAILGELAFVGERRRTASVVARTDCVLIRVDEPRVRETLNRNPMVAWKLMAAIARLIGEKFVAKEQQVRELMGSSQ